MVPIRMKKNPPNKVFHQIPPYNGYGTEADSLRNVYELIPLNKESGPSVIIPPRLVNVTGMFKVHITLINLTLINLFFRMINTFYDSLLNLFHQHLLILRETSLYLISVEMILFKFTKWLKETLVD